MSETNVSSNEQRYYDPDEVEAYINDVTKTIKTLQARLADALRRADEAERSMGDSQPETASLGRALLLASDVADKTLSEADARAEEILSSAQTRAASMTQDAEAEAQRIVEEAREAAAQVFRRGEARLLSAVSAFMEGSDVLRNELAKVEDDATSWRTSKAASTAQQTRAPRPLTPKVGSPPVKPDLPGGIHNRVGNNGRRMRTDVGSLDDESQRAAGPAVSAVDDPQSSDQG